MFRVSGSLALPALCARWGKPWLLALAASVVLAGCAAPPRLGVTVEEADRAEPARPAVLLSGELDEDEALRRQFWAARQIGHTQGYLDVARDALRAGNPGLASRALSWWLEDHPDDRAALKAQALLLLDQGQESAAITGLARWLALAPDAESAWAALLPWLAAAEDRASARRILDALLEASEARQDPVLHALIESRYAWRLMETDLAVAWAELAVELEPSLAALAWLARLQTLQGQFELAANSYERALAMAPGDELLRRRRAQVLVRAGQPERALAALSDDPPSAALRHDRIELSHRLESLAQRDRELSALAAMAAEGDAEAGFYLGLAFEGLGRWDQALRAFADVDREPWQALALEGKARALAMDGQLDASRRAFQRLRERSDATARERLWEEEALTRHAVDGYFGAGQVLDRAYSEQPLSARLRETEAWLLLLDGDLLASIRALRFAHTLSGLDAELDWGLRWLQELIDGAVEPPLDPAQLLRAAMLRFESSAAAGAVLQDLLDAASRDPRVARFMRVFFARFELEE